MSASPVEGKSGQYFVFAAQHTDFNTLVSHRPAVHQRFRPQKIPMCASSNDACHAFEGKGIPDAFDDADAGGTEFNLRQLGMPAPKLLLGKLKHLEYLRAGTMDFGA